MKRDFLEELGLSREQIDRIMAEHGKSVEALKGKCAELEARSGREQDLTEALEQQKSSNAAFRRSIIEELVDEARPSSKMARDQLISTLEADCESPRKRLSELRISDPDAFAPEKCIRPIFSAPLTPEKEAPASIPFSRIR